MQPIAIIIPTYQKNKELLIRALKSINNQTYKHWFVCLIGDRYDDNTEFEYIARNIIDTSKIYFENLPLAAERSKYAIGSRQLWCAGGVNAINYGIDKLRQFGFTYCAALDHDDVWLPNHLANIAECINETNADFICTKAVHFDNRILPINESDNKYFYFVPKGCDCIHSSICVNIKSLHQLRYRDLYELDGFAQPADADYLQQIGKLTDKCYCVNGVSVIHESEQT